MAKVAIGDKAGFIDATGKIVISPQFDYTGVGNNANSRGFKEGLSVEELNKKIGYIDKTGKMIIAPQYDYGAKFLLRRQIPRNALLTQNRQRIQTTRSDSSFLVSIIWVTRLIMSSSAPGWGGSSFNSRRRHYRIRDSHGVASMQPKNFIAAPASVHHIDNLAHDAVLVGPLKRGVGLLLSSMMLNT
ncbi:MAG: WG repeat-containing protein [Pyrinomonadaceae bacterium]